VIKTSPLASGKALIMSVIIGRMRAVQFSNIWSNFKTTHCELQHYAAKTNDLVYIQEIASVNLFTTISHYTYFKIPKKENLLRLTN